MLQDTNTYLLLGNNYLGDLSMWVGSILAVTEPSLKIIYVLVVADFKSRLFGPGGLEL